MRWRWGQAFVTTFWLLPLVLLAVNGYQHRLGANPIEAITHSTGDLALTLLVLSLAVTPLRRLTGWSGVAGYRRTFGLLAFFYALLHLATYLWLDKFFDWRDIWDDVARRPFITMGTLALTSMLPLALTSTRGWIARLGGRAWSRLHRLAYLAGIAAVVHFYWLVKSDVRKPLGYAAVLAGLLLFRLAYAAYQRRGSLARA